MKIIVGLGNYGAKYERTYHNLGFMAVDRIADILAVKIKSKECESLVAVKDDLVLAKPLTYMNLSGIAVKKLLKKYDGNLSDLIVIYDDIDLERASVRVRQKGSAGTHNGMRSIIAEIQSGDFCRIRIGAGRPEEGEDLADYVLSAIPYAHKEAFNNALDTAAAEALKLAGI